MGIRLRYGVAVGILAALFSIFGPVSAQASPMHATSVPAVSHSSVITSRTVAPDYRCGYGYDHHCGHCGYYGCGGHYDHCGYYGCGGHYDHCGYYGCGGHYRHCGYYGCYGHYSHYGYYGHYSHYGYSHYGHYR
jgi:hypothetical protein